MFTDASMTGALLRELRTVAGLGLRQMAARCSITPSYLSMIESGRRPVTATVIDAYRGALGDPTLGLAGVDLDRLAATIARPDAAGTSGATDISAILDRSRHLEDVVGSALVVPIIRGIDGVARAVAAANEAGAGLASEVARYRGWLEHAVGNRHLADKVLADAAGLAELAADGSQLAHAYSFRAYTARHTGEIGKAIALTDAAVDARDAHPILGVYDRYQRAEILAVAGDSAAAVRALHAADRAAERTDGIDLPAYGYWYIPPFWAIERAIVLSALGRTRDAEREAAAGVAAMPAQFQGSGWLASMLTTIDPDMTG